MSMPALKVIHQNAVDLARAVAELARYGILFVCAFLSSRAKTAATVVALRSQLANRVDRVQQVKEPKPRFTLAFRFVWVVLSRCLDGWEDLAQLMKPATVKRWHKQGYRLYWRWKSRKRGRPALDREMQDLIRRLSRENPLWGAERIRDTLVLLGYPPVCDDTVRKYMAKPRKPRRPSTTWLPFLRNHVDVSWAIDFFTVTTMSFSTVYVFIVLEHGRRRVRHLATTRRPSMGWVIQQLRNAMPYGEHPRYLFRDNDGIYATGLRRFWRTAASMRCGQPPKARGRIRTSNGSLARSAESCWTM